MNTALARPAWIEIDTEALLHNIREIRSAISSDAKLMAVVKADAYGHGAERISRIAEQSGVDYLGVAMLEEANELINAGIKTPIVILYPEDLKRSVEAVSSGIIISISDPDIIEKIRIEIGADAAPIRYFLKANTGMNRFGIKTNNFDNLTSNLNNGSNSKLIGITTNLAFPNGNGSELSQEQKRKFSEITKAFKKVSENGYLLSCESSGSVSSDDNLNGTLFRIGHLLYGLRPNGKCNLNLKPVMAVKSKIVEIQSVKKGEGIGYGFTFVADKNMRIAVIPLGYADGYPWSLSNQGSVLIKGEKARVVGRICMDTFMVDITNIDNCGIGDDVIVMGKMGKAEINAHQLGEWAGSFSYEILSRWSKRLPRIYK